jgi:DNA repair photolyase
MRSRSRSIPTSQPPSRRSSLQVEETPSRSILTRTGGFLSGFSHSLNPYRGCAFGNSLCGAACYAPAVLRGEKRAWGSYLGVKTNAADIYAKDLARERRRGPVRIFFSSVTDPYVPQERRYGVTRALLEAMVRDPPDKLVIQTHTPGPLRDLDLLEKIECDLTVQISVETDYERLPGLPPHAYAPAERIEALETIKRRGLKAVGVVAPLLPLRDAEAFARDLDRSCTSVIVDHYLVGDGSKDGARTKRRGLPDILLREGFEKWTRIDALHETADLFRRVLGPDRVGVSATGFNA